MKLVNKLMKEAVVLMIVFFMFLSTVLVTANSVEDDESIETLESDEYITIRSIEGTELFTLIFNSRITMTGIPVLGYYRTGDTLRACVSVDGGVIWNIPYSSKDNVFTENLYDPPFKPSITGPTEGNVGVSYDYSFSTMDPDGDNLYYWVDWADTTNSGWLGPYSSGETASASHTWSEGGTYCIKVKAKDDGDSESSWSDPLCVSIGGGENNPPEIPTKPNGVATGIVGEEYRYTASSSDPDNDLIEYGWDWKGDSIPDDWIGMYQSGSQCEIFIVFDEAGTYQLKVMAKDEHGATSDYSPTLTVEITETEECVDFMGIKVCALGNAELEIINGELLISNIGDTFLDGAQIFPHGFDGTPRPLYMCDLEVPLDSAGAAIRGTAKGVFKNENNEMSMTIGPRTASFGIYPVGFNGTASGAPSIIAWDFGDGDIAFYEQLEASDFIELGTLNFNNTSSLSSFGIYPVGFNGAASGAPSIIADPPDDAKWTWGEAVASLDIDAIGVKSIDCICLQCGWKCDKGHSGDCTYNPSNGGDGVLDFDSGTIESFEILAKGMESFVLVSHTARENIRPHTPTITGETNGKTGEEYEYTFTGVDPDSADAKLTLLPVFGNEDDDTNLYEGIYPVGFNGTASGAPSIIAWDFGDGGDYTITGIIWDLVGGYSDMGILEVTMPKNKLININHILLRFLEDHPRMFPLLQMILGL